MATAVSKVAVALGVNIDQSNAPQQEIEMQSIKPVKVHAATEMECYARIHTPTVRALLPDDLAIGSYKHVAVNTVRTTSTIMATTPTFSFGFVNSQNEPILSNSRTGHLDSVSNMTMIRKEVFEEDRSLFGEKSCLLQIKPFSIESADGQAHAVITHMLKDATVCIGCAKYEVDFLVAPDLAVD
jgi:hypothetical protein